MTTYIKKYIVIAFVLIESPFAGREGEVTDRELCIVSTNDSTEPQDAVKKAFASYIEETGAIAKIIKYILVFWGVCVIAGAGVAVGLAANGMNAEDAFQSGLVIAFLPILAFAIVSWCIFVFWL